MVRSTLVGALLLSFAFGGCKGKEAEKELAPTASALAAPMPASPNGVALDIDGAKSSVTFLMDSPLEKIDGDAPGSVSGELSLDLDDLGTSNALVKVDLDKLTLYQQRRAEEAKDYSERKKNDKQNEHARDWLQIVPHEGEVTAEQAAMNRIAEFRIDKVETATPNVRSLGGAERKVTASVSGDLRLHGRKERQTAKVELTFHFAGEKFQSLDVKTIEPLPVNLERYEINPRDGAGKFVKTITDAVSGSLKGKLQKDAPVTLAFSAKAK
ncbi:MAG TPA: YceI family protein [Polyangiaceae bacterium]